MKYFLSLIVFLVGAFVGQTLFTSPWAIWMAGAITAQLALVIMATGSK